MGSSFSISLKTLDLEDSRFWNEADHSSRQRLLNAIGILVSVKLDESTLRTKIHFRRKSEFLAYGEFDVRRVLFRARNQQRRSASHHGFAALRTLWWFVFVNSRGCLFGHRSLLYTRFNQTVTIRCDKACRSSRPRTVHGHLGFSTAHGSLWDSVAFSCPACSTLFVRVSLMPRSFQE